MDASVSTTLQHTIAYLLNPISSLYSPNAIDSLHNSLLSAFSILTTVPSTAEHRLLISPTAPTPPIIARALSALPPHLRVNWADWCLLLSNGNSVALSIKFYPTGRVIATSVDPSNGTADRVTVYDAMENNVRRASRIWGNGPSMAYASRSSAASSASSSDFDLEYSSSSRSSSPDVVAVETAENVLSGIYDDDEQDRISYSKMASAFGGLSLLPPRASPTSVPMVGSKTTLSAAAAEWFPRGNLSNTQRAPVQPSMSMKRFSLGGSPFTTPLAPQQQQRGLPTPIGAHRVPGGGHSRSSSRSSTLSLGTAPSLSSTMTSSGQSASPTSPTPSSPTLSDTTGSVELYLDASKDQLAVTEYECGKVGVLTGAVMLGVPKNSSNATANRHWRKTQQPGVGMVSSGSARRIC